MNLSYKIRGTLLFFLLCTLYTVIIIKLYVIQIARGSYYTDLGGKQYHISVTAYPSRAFIFDRTGNKPLAMNKESYSAFITPYRLKQSNELKSFLQKHFTAAYNRLLTHPDDKFMYVKRRLTSDEMNSIKQSNLSDLHVLHEPSRFYPVPSAGPIVGITNIDNEGLFGIELKHNELLAGAPSTCLIEKDARSDCFHFKKETAVIGKEGTPLTLTIDGSLQFLAHQELQQSMNHFKASAGAVVIMDPTNGDILTLVSSPDFDPNNTKELNIEHAKAIPITESFELGSVIKVFASIAALEEGVVTPDEIIDCKGMKTAYIDGRKINTWRAHGQLPFYEVIARSNNIGMAQVTKRVGDKLYEHYCRVGFGKGTHICLPGEQCGFVNPPDKWSKQSIISLSYGYEITATLLQLARAFSIIANGGFWIQPRLLMDDPIKKGKTPLYSKNTISQMREILAHTTQQGTTRRAKIEGYNIMSKSGTANLLIDGKYDEKRNIYTCAGIVERDGYKRIIITFIKEAHGRNLFASTVAAPLFERVAQKMLIHEKIV